MFNDNFSNGSNTITISYELLALLRWLADHDTHKLKKIIGKAFKSGLQHEMDTLNRNETPPIDEIHSNVVDFLELLEVLLIETMSEQMALKVKQQKLLPEIDKVDSAFCDDTTVRRSLEKISPQLSVDPDANAKEMFHKELLKRWNPNNKRSH